MRWGLRVRVFLLLFSLTSLYAGSHKESFIRRIIRIHSVRQGFGMLVEVSNSVRLAEQNFYLGAVYHQMALVSPYPFASNAVVCLRRAVERKTNAVYLAWLGSALGIQGEVFFHDTRDRDSALSVEESGVLLDRALSLEPDNLNIRFLRLESGIFTGHFSIYKRYRVIENDVVFLLWKKDRMGDEERARLYELAGELANALGRPRRKVVYYLELAVETAPESVFAAKALKLLDEEN